MNPLFESNLLNASTHAMADLIHYLDYPVDVKDVKSWKYILNNRAASEVSGLAPEERIGLDIHDIGRINKIKDSAVEKVVKADCQVASTSRPVSFHHIFLQKNGMVLIDKVVKKPVLGQNNKTIAVLSYAYNVTPYIDLSQLYGFYKSYYPKKLAIQIFLKHLKIENYFREIPTDQELQTLLTMRENLASSKYVARVMNLSPRTIEEYKSRLRNKLQAITFDKLLLKLRGYAQHDNFIS
jgi:DNA-binding CsgD family transcriptional regulator